VDDQSAAGTETVVAVVLGDTDPLPLVFTGIAATGSCTRRPVGLDRSRRVKRLFGNGRRHGVLENGWQAAACELAAARAWRFAPAIEVNSPAERPAVQMAAARQPSTVIRVVRFADILLLSPRRPLFRDYKSRARSAVPTPHELG
jgi:hypothetical protein